MRSLLEVLGLPSQRENSEFFYVSHFICCTNQDMTMDHGNSDTELSSSKLLSRKSSARGDQDKERKIIKHFYSEVNDQER